MVSFSPPSNSEISILILQKGFRNSSLTSLYQRQDSKPHTHYCSIMNAFLRLKVKLEFRFPVSFLKNGDGSGISAHYSLIKDIHCNSL